MANRVGTQTVLFCFVLFCSVQFASCSPEVAGRETTRHQSLEWSLVLVLVWQSVDLFQDVAGWGAVVELPLEGHFNNTLLAGSNLIQLN